jgi:hypothetical protein
MFVILYWAVLHCTVGTLVFKGKKIEGEKKIIFKGGQILTPQNGTF